LNTKFKTLFGKWKNQLKNLKNKKEKGKKQKNPKNKKKKKRKENLNLIFMIINGPFLMENPNHYHNGMSKLEKPLKNITLCLKPKLRSID